MNPAKRGRMNPARQSPVFGPIVDMDYLRMTVAAGPGPVTSAPHASGEIACMRTLPGVYDVCPRELK